MKQFRKWLSENPGEAIWWILFLTGLFALTLATFYGCAGSPPRRFENGDKTVFGPRTYGDVVEGDMAKPEEDPE